MTETGTDGGMHLFDITGPIEDGMWYARSFYPPTVVRDLPPQPWPSGEGSVYGQYISFGSQAGTNMATGAHLYEGRPDIASISLERLLVPAVIARVTAAAHQRIHLSDVAGALRRSGVAPTRGGALLIATGWDRHWNEPWFLDASPGMAYDLVRWAVDQQLSILGTDFPAWDAHGSENFWPEFYASDVLPLAPLVNVNAVPAVEAELIALPLKIRHSVGSPCRAILRVAGNADTPDPVL